MGPVLRSERLTLRPWRDQDAPALRMLLDDWKVARMLSRVPYPYTAADARAFLEIAKAAAAKRPREAWHWAITESNTGLLLGGAGLHNEPAGWETGYWLADLFWGFGFATEACRRVLDFAFEEARLERVVAGHYLDNEGSARVLEKAGFEPAGVTLRHSRARDELVQCRDMAVTRADWLAASSLPAGAAERVQRIAC